MWVLRRFKYCLLVGGSFLCVLSVVYHFTNVFDVFFFLLSQEPYELPLALHCNTGRLGNQMCTYATLYGISALNHRATVALSCNVRHLKGIFTGPSKVQSIDESLYFKLHPWKLIPYLKPEDATVSKNSNFLEGYKYPCSYTFFDHARDGLRREFQFEEHLDLYAQSILQKANVRHVNNVTYVGVHVRRGDYEKRWLEVYKGVPVNMEYFRKAIQYFRDRYNNTIFIAVSDDRLWCIHHLSMQFGVYVPEDAPSPAHDLALLANCNHTILTYGTFGFWGAYLAGGEVLYFDKFLKPNTTFTRKKFLFEKMYPPQWKGVVTIDVSKYFTENDREKEKQNVSVVKV